MDALPFDPRQPDPTRHQNLLEGTQKLRARVYLQDGAIREDQVTSDGRFAQPADDRSWHLLTVDATDRVTACIRYLAHPPGASYADLSISHVLSNQPKSFGMQVERAVRAELTKAARLGFSYVELGAWVVSEELRCSTEAIRIVLLTYALSQLLGGAIALSTATKRHRSSSILRRTGGMALIENGLEIPSYFDPFYNCEMEMVAFDSRTPNPRYLGWIREFRETLARVPIVSASNCGVTADLLKLNSALAAPEEPADKVIRISTEQLARPRVPSGCGASISPVPVSSNERRGVVA